MSESWHPSVGKRTIRIKGQPVEMTLEIAPEGVQAVGRWEDHEVRETGRTLKEAESSLFRTLLVLIG